MARPLRITPPGTLQHVMTRFVDREHRITCDEERTEYLTRLGTAITNSDWSLVSFAVMSTHVHWSAIAGQAPFDRVVKGLHSSFARWLNRRQGRLGPVFADRPNTVTVELAAAGRLIAYHHNNPVRAGLVECPSDSSWTSHRHYLRIDACPSWLDVELGLRLAGFDDDEHGWQQLARWVHACRDEPDADALTGGELRRAQQEASSHVQRPVEAGYPSLVRRTLLFPIRISGPTPRCLVADLVDAVAERTGVGTPAIRGTCRRRGAANARKVVVLAARLLGMTQRQIGHELAITRTAVSKIELRAQPAVIEEALAVAEKLAEQDAPRQTLDTWIQRVA